MYAVMANGQWPIDRTILYNMAVRSRSSCDCGGNGRGCSGRTVEGSIDQMRIYRWSRGLCDCGPATAAVLEWAMGHVGGS